MKPELETVSCPVCAHRKVRERFSAPDRFDDKNGKQWKVVTCAKCDFTYLNPRPGPDFIAQYYSNAQYQPFLSTQEKRTVLDTLYCWIRYFNVKHKRRTIEKIKFKGSLLDIGCGTGEFLKEMQEHGWETAGIEKDRDAAQVAKKVYHLNVTTGDMLEFRHSHKRFDVITFWHVLEHLPDPKRSLNQAGELLEKEGVILVALPNIASFDAHFYRENWVALDAPRHLHHFEPHSLKTLCEQSKMVVVSFRQMVFDVFFNCLMSEMLVLSRNPSKKVYTPFYVLRALIVAGVSLASASRLRRKDSRQGSSHLYFIKKMKSG